MSGPRREEDKKRYPADPKPASPPPRRKYPADSLQPPPPPERPKQDGPRRWDMNRKAPPEWQREKPPNTRGQSAELSAPKDKWNGRDSIDGRSQNPRERADMMRGAYWAGRNGDAGAAGSFPNTPEGRAQRREYERGLRDRQQEQRRKRPGIGFATR